MAFWCYMLKCADGKYYTGHTDDLDRRINEHIAGGHCDFTSRRLPVTLIWSERFSTRVEALESERHVKKWSRAKKEALAQGDWGRVAHFAKPPHERVSTASRRSAVHPEPAEGLDTNGEGPTNRSEDRQNYSRDTGDAQPC